MRARKLAMQKDAPSPWTDAAAALSAPILRLKRGIAMESTESTASTLPSARRFVEWPLMVEHGTARLPDGMNAGASAPLLSLRPASAPAQPLPAAAVGAAAGADDAKAAASHEIAGGEQDAATRPAAPAASNGEGAQQAFDPNGEDFFQPDPARRSRIVGELYQSAYHRVFAFVRRSVADEAAEEISHEVFIRLLKVRNLERMTISVAYLLRIAENLLKRRFERAQRYRVVLERSGMVVPGSSESQERGLGSDPWPSSPGGVDCDAGRLESVLCKLTSEEQAAVRLIVCEGLDYQAAARSLGVPVSTINNWKHRGLAKLRLLIEQQPPHGSPRRGLSDERSAAGRSPVRRTSFGRSAAARIPA